ncbi:VWFA domain-containing protein [Entamoeba marina]
MILSFLSLIIFINSALATTCSSLVSGTSYSIEDAFECIDSLKTTEEYNTNLVNSLKTLLDTYVYKDILKSPPQPTNYPSYFETIDIDESLDNVNVTETSMYSFYQEVKDIFHKIHDLHLSFSLTSNSANDYVFDSFYAVIPISIEIENNGTEVYFNPYSNLALYGVTVPEMLTTNGNISIATVNGMQPLDWIRDYADTFSELKSPHGKFTNVLDSIYLVSLTLTPLTKNYLSTPINIVYENGDELSISYELLYLKLDSVSENVKEKITKKITRKDLSPLVIADLFDTPKLVGETIYDYQSTDGFIACKTYDEEDKQINMLMISSFYPTTYIESYLTVFSQCFDLFDSNTYPISIVLPMNGGGMVTISQMVENILASYSDVRITNSVRISNGTANCVEGSYSNGFTNANTCEVIPNFSTSEFYTNPVVDTYGEYEHYRTQPTTTNLDSASQMNLQNLRKPTEIVVFTDGYCYSVCSLLAKDLKEKGNAIVVGFEGDPEGDLNLFDAGQSPTFVIDSAATELNESDFITEIGGTLQISFVETYVTNYEYNETIPREFIIDPVDERVHIYKYDETKLGTFAESALEIIEKYKTSCNADNDKLHLIKEWDVASDSVDHAYVGYLCDDGVWSTVETPVYCDKGYFLDLNTRKCVENVCYVESSQTSESSQTNESSQESTTSTDDSSNSSENVDGCSTTTIMLSLFLLFILL